MIENTTQNAITSIKEEQKPNDIMAVIDSLRNEIASLKAKDNANSIQDLEKIKQEAIEKAKEDLAKKEALKKAEEFIEKNTPLVNNKFEVAKDLKNAFNSITTDNEEKEKLNMLTNLLNLAFNTEFEVVLGATANEKRKNIIDRFKNDLSNQSVLLAEMVAYARSKDKSEIEGSLIQLTQELEHAKTVKLNGVLNNTKFINSDNPIFNVALAFGKVARLRKEAKQ